MERVSYQPRTKQEWLALRAKDLTSTEVSSLFNISPYLTSYELWHRKKKSQIVEIDENERMKWGNRLESAIARGIAEDNGWLCRPKKEYISLPGLKLGSSFDFVCFINSANSEDFTGQWLLEIKNVDSFIFKDGWSTDGDQIEAPPHVEMQSQHQMLVSGINVAYIGALVGGNKVTLLKRTADESIHKAILKKSAQFWDSIEKNQEPSPDFVRDAGFISKLYGYAEPGKLMDATAEINALVETYKQESDTIKEHEKKKESLKSQLLTIVGDSEKVLGDYFTISAGMVGEAPISYIRKAFRNFRISFRKKK